MRVVGPLLLLVSTALAVGCADRAVDSREHAQTLVDSGNPTSHDAGLGGRPASVEAGTGGHRASTDAGTGSGATGSGGAANSDASVAFFAGDAGPEPPPYCVAPCVWDVVKRCIPTLNTCVTDADAGPVHGYDSITCDPTTGWSVFGGVVGIKRTATEVRHDGRACFTWTSTGALGGTLSSLTDWSGRAAALRDDDRVTCGIELRDMNGARSVDGGAELADGRTVPAYQMEPNRPECATWERTGLPVAPPCESTTSGACP